MSQLQYIIGQVCTYKAKYNLQSFVETGCYQGDSLATAIDAGFENLYSCDIDKDAVAMCRSRFGEKVDLYLGESPDFLRHKLPTVKRPALFWLDAHFPQVNQKFNEFAKPTDPNRIRFPLPEELQIINDLGLFNDSVILIDDARIYTDSVIHDTIHPAARDWAMVNMMIKDVIRMMPNHVLDESFLDKWEGIFVFLPHA